HVGVVTDDLDGVFIRTYGTIRAQAPELTVDRALRRGDQLLAQRQRQIGHIILDTDRELRLFGVVINSYDLCRCGILGTQTITSRENRSLIELGSLQSCHNIQIQGLTLRTGLLGSIQNGNQLYSV